MKNIFKMRCVECGKYVKIKFSIDFAGADIVEFNCPNCHKKFILFL